ncbi:MAG TPA: oligopeptide ABC transporter ATP-binding protein OppF, partial [Rhodospirillaceae bacterium]|nr:oligopeptide ABC transporter ATP-binding protein OppF [Rhodospirillaceae bacterium]
MSGYLLNVRDLKVHFPVRVGGALIGKYLPLKAVDDISLNLLPGKTLGVVGESGCGKSTLGRAILQLLPVTDGSIVWLGQDLSVSDKKALK